jgi:GT2 family glycosyltransferase
MDRITIVIVHYHQDKETRECLQSLLKVKAEGFQWSVVVVDNGSKLPFQLPPRLQNPHFEVIRSESNLGFTGGNNLGIHYALEKYNPDHVLLLNNDTIVTPQFLIDLYKATKKHPKWGMINPKIYFYPGMEFHPGYSAAEKGHVLWFAGGCLDWTHLDAFHKGVDEVDRGQFDEAQTTDFVTGCCLLVRRQVLETVGLLDEDYFLYSEDVDWSLRTKQSGFELGYWPQSVIWHKNAGSSGGAGSPLHVYYQSRNRLLLAWRYGSWRTRLTALRLGLNWLRSGDSHRRLAMWHLLSGQLGKQPVV